MFAIIKLIRAVAPFMIAPVLLHVAVVIGNDPVSGASTALWICSGISTGGTLISLARYLLGGVRPPTPALPEWASGAEPGCDSPPLLARVHGNPAQP